MHHLFCFRMNNVNYHEQGLDMIELLLSKGSAYLLLNCKGAKATGNKLEYKLFEASLRYKTRKVIYKSSSRNLLGAKILKKLQALEGM